MKINELRIGNCVQHELGEKRTGYIIQIDRYSVILKLKYSKLSCSIKEVNPIELTEELLLSLGFEFYKPLSQYRIVINDIWYSIKITVSGNFLFSFVNLNYDEVNHMPPKYIKYVHQLQNLYFALTGEELTLKP